jgi:putrescine aminotransferase
MSRFWHPFAAMADHDAHRLTIARGEGVWVWDDHGRRYLDGTAALWYANVGHGRREILYAIVAQAQRLEAYSAFGDLSNPPAEELAARLSAVAPVAEAQVFFTGGGGEAIDTAAKLARAYWALAGRPEKDHLIARVHSYHGVNGYGTGLGGIAPNRQGMGPLVPDISHVAHDSLDALAGELGRLGPDRVAAVFAEPVIGAGGVRPPAPGYLEGVQELCRRHDVLLVADCVISGFGRLGGWWGTERFRLEPDMVTFAKGVTSGYLPLGGVVVAPRVWEPFFAPGAPIFRHGSTYAGHPTVCAAALANVDLLEREGLVARGAELEQPLMEALAPLAEHELVAEVRGGVGLLAAVALEPDVLAERPAAPLELGRLTREAGVLVRPLADGVAVSPPLTIEAELLGTIADAVGHGLDRVAGELGRAPSASPARA